MIISQEIKIEIETGIINGVTVCPHRLVEGVMFLQITALRVASKAMQTVRVHTATLKV